MLFEFVHKYCVTLNDNVISNKFWHFILQKLILHPPITYIKAPPHTHISQVTSKTPLARFRQHAFNSAQTLIYLRIYLNGGETVERDEAHHQERNHIYHELRFKPSDPSRIIDVPGSDHESINGQTSTNPSGSSGWRDWSSCSDEQRVPHPQLTHLLHASSATRSISEPKNTNHRLKIKSSL